MGIKTFVTRNPLTADEATYAVGTMNTEASIWLNNLSTLTAEVDYSLNDIKTQTVQLNDWLTIVDEYNRKYEFTVEEIRYVANALEITATELGVIATQNQLNELNYVNQQAVDILAGERDGPFKTSPLSTYQLELTSSSTSDVDRRATIAGFNSSGEYTSEILPLQGTTTVTSATTWSEIHYITMSSATAGIITMTDGTNTLAKLGVGNRRVANTDAVGTYGNGVCYKIYNLPTPTMAVKVATKFDNFNGASQQSGFTYTGSSANSTSWASEGTHSVNIPASSTISKSIDFGTTNEIWQIEFDVYLNTLGTLTVTAGATTLATINSGAGEWQTIKLDTSAITGTQTLTFTTAAGTDVYVDSIRYMDNKYVVPYADDPINAIQFDGENALQGIAKVCNFSVVSATNQSYDFKIKDNEDQEAWNVTKTLQLYFKPQVGSATPVLSLSSSDALNNLSYNLSAYDIINRVTVYGGGDGAFRKFASAEDATSQSLYGVRTPQNPPSYPDVDDTSILQSIADAIIEKYKDPVVNFETELVLQNLNADIGDTITVDDTQLGIHFEKIITRINYKYANNSEGYISLELADVTDDLTVDAIALNRDRNNLNTANKGAVNVVTTGETQNVDAANPLLLEFYMPEDLTQINYLNLNYSVNPYQTYHGSVPTDQQLSKSYPFNVTNFTNWGTSTVVYGYPSLTEIGLSSETNIAVMEIKYFFYNQTGGSADFATYPLNFRLGSNDINTALQWTVTNTALGNQSGRVYFQKIFPVDDEFMNWSGTSTGLVVNYNAFSSPVGFSMNGSITITNFHNHDVFPIIETIPKDIDGITIEISDDGGSTYTDVTADLTSLYGTLHLSDTGPSSQTTYNLDEVYTFQGDKWYIVKMTPTNNETIWNSFDSTTDVSLSATGGNDVWGSLTTDAVVKTQGIASNKFTQSTSAGYGLFKWTPNTPINMNNKRYIIFDIYMPDTPANLGLSTLMFMVTSDDSTDNLAFGQPAGGEPQAQMAWSLPTASFSTGGQWYTVKLDMNDLNNKIWLQSTTEPASGTAGYQLGTTTLNKGAIEGIFMRGTFDGTAGSTNDWRIDNLRYLSGGLCRIRADLFNNFYLETGGSV